MDQRPHEFTLCNWLEAHGLEVIQPAVDQEYNGFMKKFSKLRFYVIQKIFLSTYGGNRARERSGYAWCKVRYQGCVTVAFVAHHSFVTSDELSAVTGPFL